MKKFFIISSLIFSIICNPVYCVASDDFDYGINKTSDANFNDTSLVEDDSGQAGKLTTYDFVPLFNRSVIVPVKENVSALIRSFCNMCSGGYDLTKAILETYCGDNSNYSFTIKTENEFLSTDSVNGSTLILGVPEGEFSAYISNNCNMDLSCNTYLMGVGSDTTPEEGFNISLTCYDKLPDGKKTNMWYWLGPVIGVVGAAAIGGSSFGGYRALHGADASGGEFGP